MSASNSLAAASSRLLILTVSPIAVTPIVLPKPMRADDGRADMDADRDMDRAC